MSHIRHKKIKNKLYAYEVTSVWDKNLKQCRSKSKYLGPVDPATQQVISFVKKERGCEKSLLDFGDTYFFYKFILESNLYELLNNLFFKKHHEILPLMIYRLCTQSAMYHCEEWIVKPPLIRLFKNRKLSAFI